MFKRNLKEKQLLHTIMFPENFTIYRLLQFFLMFLTGVLQVFPKKYISCLNTAFLRHPTDFYVFIKLLRVVNSRLENLWRSLGAETEKEKVWGGSSAWSETIEPIL